ncbi:hypothetical protein ABW19_dt0206309 [Dactylella cylindrospora]|nr:hypothetical protein ABW19_dt0206309 [Dactylella cylindrospora]
MPPQQTNPPVPRHNLILPNTPVSIILKADQPTGRQVTGLVAQVLTRGDHHRGVKVRLKDGRVGRVQKIIREDEVSAAATTSGGGGGGLFAPADISIFNDYINRANGEGGVDVSKGVSIGVDINSSSSHTGRGGRRQRGSRRGNFDSEPATPRDGDGVERTEEAVGLLAFVKPEKQRKGRGGKRRGRGRGGGGGDDGDTSRGGMKSGVGSREAIDSGGGAVEATGSQDRYDPTAGIFKQTAMVKCPVCNDFEGDEAAVEHHVGTHFA